MKKMFVLPRECLYLYDCSTRIICRKSSNISLYCKHVTFGDVEAKLLSIIEDLNCKLCIQINQPTRCINLSDLLLVVQIQLNMFRAFSCPSSGAYKLLMMGKRMPETCWAVFERRAINLRDWCIWLVDLFECMMMHGLVNPKFVSYVSYFSNTLQFLSDLSSLWACVHRFVGGNRILITLHYDTALLCS